MAEEKQSIPGPLGPGDKPTPIIDEAHGEKVIIDDKTAAGNDTDASSEDGEKKKKEKSGSLKDFIVGVTMLLMQLRLT